MEFCSHCQTEQSDIVVKGKRLVRINRREQLVPYALCKACNHYLRSASYKQCNNVKHDKSDRLKNNFWHKVDLTLKNMQKNMQKNSQHYSKKVEQHVINNS